MVQRFCKHNTVELMNSEILTMDLLQVPLEVFRLHIGLSAVVVVVVPVVGPG